MSSIEEYSSRDASTVDGLFLERLETFMDKCLADIKAFSERELRPFEETRRSVAEWHAKHLFHSSLSRGIGQPSRHEYVRTVLMDTSRVLESLAEAAGVQSFILAVDPKIENDAGFLGGSLTGREFWRSIRGGGDQGARAFKQYCTKHDTTPKASATHTLPIPSSSGEKTPSIGNKLDSKSVKADLYETVRRALKTASGVRTAEMKWSNPERLDLYGVRLVGWPPSIPPQNPSTLKMNQNKQLLDAFKDGTARFERLPTSLNPAPPPTPEIEIDNGDDFSWAYDPDASPKISSKAPIPTDPGAIRVSSRLSSPMRPSSATSTRENTPGSSTLCDSSLNRNQLFVDDWEGDFRCRKRPRSEEP